MLGNGRIRRPWVVVFTLALAISSVISIGVVISAKADDDDLKGGTFIPTGVHITPSAAPGSSFQALNPGLAFDPGFTVGQAVTTAISPNGNTLLILTSGYNSQNFTSGPNKGNTNPDESNEYIFVFDISGGKPVQTQVLQVPNAFDGIAFNPSGKEFYVSGGPRDKNAFLSLKGSTWVDSGGPVKTWPSPAPALMNNNTSAVGPRGAPNR